MRASLHCLFRPMESHPVPGYAPTIDFADLAWPATIH
jgi:hypothetical protein